MKLVFHMLLFLFLGGVVICLLAPEYITKTGIDKDFISGLTPSPPSREMTHVYYFKSYRTHIYECNISEANALKFATHLFGNDNIKIINEPIRIVRYNSTNDAKKYCYERENLSIEDETNSSCFHFIRNGYYYTTQYLYWAYDKENGKMYMCRGAFER